MAPNPARIFRTLTAFHETAALKAGIELELFTAIAEGHATPADLARRIGASEKGTWVRTFDPPAEGRVVRGFEGMDVGERARVRLVQTDVARGFIDFVRA